jgi:hypothetical protein
MPRDLWPEKGNSAAEDFGRFDRVLSNPGKPEFRRLRCPLFSTFGLIGWSPSSPRDGKDKGAIPFMNGKKSGTG